MAFLKTNYRRGQYIAKMRQTILVDSAVSFAQFAFSGIPAPAAMEEVIYQLYEGGKPTYPIRIGGSFSFSGIYIAATIYYSQTFAAAMDETISIIGVFHWLVGSR